MAQSAADQQTVCVVIEVSLPWRQTISQHTLQVALIQCATPLVPTPLQLVPLTHGTGAPFVG